MICLRFGFCHLRFPIRPFYKRHLPIHHPRESSRPTVCNAAWEEKRGYPADNKLPVELYNLKDDIGQKHNLAEEHPDKVTELQALLAKIRKQGHSAPRLAN